MQRSIESILEQKLNQDAKAHEDEDSILSSLYILSSKYAKLTGNQVVLRCETPSGSRVLSYNSAPRRRENKPQAVAEIDAALPSPQSSSCSPSAKKPGKRLDPRTESRNTQKAYRHLVLECVRKDLKNPSLKAVPLRKLSVFGWPKEIPIKMTEQRVKHVEILTDLLRSGEIRFELKE
jgi:hypothetical protein